MDAKQAEKDGRCWDCELIGALAMARREIDTLRAQVAVMVGLLNEFTELSQNDFSEANISDWVDLFDRVEVALKR